MEKIQIYLGLAGDGPVCHQLTTTPGNYAGQAITGPLKLLELLELHLGLGGIYLSEKSRVIMLKEKLSIIQGDGFLFSAAFRHDPLGVSKRLLNLWDSWRMAGWKISDTEAVPKRMLQLSGLKTVFAGLGAGTVERISAILKVLDNESLQHLCIQLVDPVESFPYLYQQLLNKLAEKVAPTAACFLPQASPQTDLGKLQRLINGEVVEEGYTNDHSLQLLLFFPDDILAANAAFAIRQASNWNPLLVNADNSLLNGLELSHNQPVCNWQTSSGNGQIAQLFFLATALFKRPVNCTQVLAFLAAPITPFSKTLSQKLLELFAAKPGFANEEWNAVIEEYLTTIKNKDEEAVKKKAVKFWLQHSSFLQEPYLDVKMLIEIYSTLGGWATKTAHYPYYEMYSEQLQNLSSLCGQLINSLQQEELIIGVAKFERLQSELFSDITAVITTAQVGSADAISHPGATWCQTKEILWMNAVRYEASGYLSKYWYQEEKVYFQNKGLQVPDESHANAIYNAGLKRMVLCTKERLVIIIPKKIGGTVTAKPFCLDEWNQLLSLEPVTINAGNLLSTIPWEEGSQLTRSYLAINLPVANSFVKIKGGEFVREKESYSSLEKLFQHPAQWFIEYKLKLKYKQGISLPPEALLKGTIADSVVQAMFKEEYRALIWWKSNDQFIQKVEDILNLILSKEGLPFLENRLKRFLPEYKKTLIAAVSNLRNFIDQNDFVIKATQSLVTGNIGNTVFEGFADMLLSKNGKDCIIDLKWAGSSKKYLEKIKNGNDLQLALYQVMQPGADKAGYFLFNDGKMYMRDEPGTRNLKLVNLVLAEDGIAAANVFEKAINSLQFRRDELMQGKAETAYNCLLEEIDYYIAQPADNKNLYPLTEINKNKQGLYDNDLDLFFGNIS